MFRIIALEYGEPLPLGVGSFDHPSGDASCNLQVWQILEVEGLQQAIQLASDLEEEDNCHTAQIHVSK